MTDRDDLYRVSGERLWSDLMASARFGGTSKGGICRLTLSPDDAAVRQWFGDTCREAGMEVSTDAIGNQIARRQGLDASLPPIAMGSHLDTQVTGGRFDGILGVLAGLEVVRTLNDAGIVTRHPIEIIDWTNEEGARFSPAMVGSGVFAGVFDLDYALARVDKNGVSLGQALEAGGFNGPLPVRGRPLAAHFELHIEQGPVLESLDREIGVVTGVQGIRWFDVTVSGQSCHAGTTPMTMRKDPVQGVARLAAAVDLIGRSDPGKSLSTIGIVEARPGAHNTVPGTVRISIDLRHPATDGLDRMERELGAAIEAIEPELGIAIEMVRIWSSPPVAFDPDVIASIQRSTDRFGYSNQRMVSGAGHDSVYVSRVAPTGMIFIPCEGGVSHNEAENITSAQAEAGANVLLNAVLDFDRRVAP